MLERTLAAMRAKAPDAGWRAWVGPGISPDAFEVGRDVLDVFMADDPATESYFRPGRPARQMANRPAWTGEFRLRRAGVGDVTLSRLCTVADGGRFFRTGATG